MERWGVPQNSEKRDPVAQLGLECMRRASKPSSVKVGGGGAGATTGDGMGDKAFALTVARAASAAATLASAADTGDTGEASTGTSASAALPSAAADTAGGVSAVLAGSALMGAADAVPLG